MQFRTGKQSEYRETRLEDGWRNKSQARTGEGYVIEKCQSDVLLEAGPSQDLTLC